MKAKLLLVLAAGLLVTFASQAQTAGNEDHDRTGQQDRRRHQGHNDMAYNNHSGYDRRDNDRRENRFDRRDNRDNRFDRRGDRFENRHDRRFSHRENSFHNRRERRHDRRDRRQEFRHHHGRHHQHGHGHRNGRGHHNM